MATYPTKGSPSHDLRQHSHPESTHVVGPRLIFFQGKVYFWPTPTLNLIRSLLSQY